MILALDLGTNTGWAVRHPDGRIHSSTIRFQPSRYEGGGMRFLRFEQWLEKLDVPKAVVFEEVRRHAGTDAAHVYGGFLAVLTAWCERLNVPYQGVPVQTIKRSACGKGNANKEAMIEAAKNLGFNPADDNEADAIHIAVWAGKNLAIR